MRVLIKVGFLVFIAAGAILACKGESSGKSVAAKETLLAGNITIYVDNTVQPIVEDVLAVFHSVYDRAGIKQANRTEKEIIQLLLNDSATVAVLPRKLSAEEEAYFIDKKIKPRIEEFATDAIALIVNERSKDSVINLEEILKVLRGQPSGKVQKLVFDNAGSSTVQYLMKMAGVNNVAAGKIYSLNSNEEVIKYIHDNDGAIGVIGLNWLLQPPGSLTNYVKNIKVLGVDNVNVDKTEKKYYKPSQEHLATGFYPLTRKLYVLNYQGRQGLGMGFATYTGGIEGQRIILKSGLLPVRIPTREIAVRNELETTK